MNVTAVEVTDWDKGADGIVKVSNVTFDDGSKAPGYDLPPGIEVGKPLPEGWEIATSKAGKPYIKVPKPGGKGGFGGGPAAFRNTKEGFLLEQDSIHRSVALQQAVILAERFPAVIPTTVVMAAADEFYDWLRKSAGVVPAMGMGQAPAVQPAGVGMAGVASAPAVSPAEPDTAGRRAGTSQDHTASSSAPSSEEGEGFGKASLLSSGACEHSGSPLKLDGTSLPGGRLRCINCGLVSDTKGVWK